MAKFRVAILNAPHPHFDVEGEILGDIADVCVVWCDTGKEVVEAASSADALMVADITSSPLTAEILKQLKKLKVISIYGVGSDLIDLKAAREQGVVVANAPDYGTSEVADHTMALMLSLLRKVPMLEGTLKECGWERARSNVGKTIEFVGEIRRLDGLTLGLVGFGRIARAVAERARVFGFRIIGYDPYVQREAFAKVNVEKVDLSCLLRESDIISIHVLLTDETRHMIGEKEIREIKRGAFAVNTSRGAVMDEQALIKALKDGHLAGAALDVFEKEPLPADSPLLRMKNVILTPHMAWYSKESMLDQKRKTAVNVRRVLEGELPLYPVNL